MHPETIKTSRAKLGSRTPSGSRTKLEDFLKSFPPLRCRVFSWSWERKSSNSHLAPVLFRPTALNHAQLSHRRKTLERLQAQVIQQLIFLKVFSHFKNLPIELGAGGCPTTHSHRKVLSLWAQELSLPQNVLWLQAAVEYCIHSDYKYRTL